MRGNFFAGEQLVDLADAQRSAEAWCTTTAALRIHGTTAARPVEQFAELEELVGKRVDVRADSRLVTVFSRGQLVKTQPRVHTGGRSTESLNPYSRGVAVALATLLVMVGSAVAALRGVHWGTAVMILTFGVWLLVDDPLAGPKLLTLTENHGVHVGDILALVGIVIVLLALGRRRGSRRIHP